MLRKAMVMTALLALAPFVGMLTSSNAEAHSGVAVSGGIVIASPVAVFGFSYGDPFVVGHVHANPVYCSHGPLYYYPAYHVYGHYAPRYAYYNYNRPVVRHSHRYYVGARGRNAYHPARFENRGRHPGQRRGVSIRGHRGRH